ncbi:MAG: hypothetical protein WC976_06645 [Caldisericia bacterium]
MVKVGDVMSGFLLKLVRAVALRQKYSFTVLEFVNDYDHVRVLRDNATEDIVPVISILPSEEEVAASGH